MVILGTQYAGEMKKGIFSVMHYLMPKRGILSLHSGCNVGANNDVSLFFRALRYHSQALQAAGLSDWPERYPYKFLPKDLRWGPLVCTCYHIPRLVLFDFSITIFFLSSQKRLCHHSSKLALC